jgi:hypothetical protein
VKRIQQIIVVVIAVIAVVISTSAPNVNADYCMWLPLCDEYGLCSYEPECWPEYYAWQTAEPDWSLYRTGDEVEIHYEYVAETASWHPTGWYVTPASDPGRDGNYCVVWVKRYVRLLQYPW